MMLRSTGGQTGKAGRERSLSRPKGTGHSLVSPHSLVDPHLRDPKTIQMIVKRNGETKRRFPSDRRKPFMGCSSTPVLFKYFVGQLVPKGFLASPGRSQSPKSKAKGGAATGISAEPPVSAENCTLKW